MRRMLIDDNDAVAGLRDDVGLVQLRACRPERRVKCFRRGGRRIGAPIGGGRIDDESALLALAETISDRRRRGERAPPTISLLRTSTRQNMQRATAGFV